MGPPTLERKRSGSQDIQRAIADTVPIFHTTLDPAPHVVGLIRPNPFKYEYVRMEVRRHAGITIEGKENLEKARKLQQQGKKVIYMANHLSNSDGPIDNFAFDQEGIHRVAFILGKRLMDDPNTKDFVDCVWIIPVWPPTEKPRNKYEESQKNHMLLQSRRAFRAALDWGFAVVVYPEGGRSYTGYMKDEVGPEIAGYLRNVDDAFVVPFGNMGTENVLPVGETKAQDGEVTLVFNEEPVEVAKLRAKYDSLSRNDQNKAIMEEVMRRIANSVAPSYRGRWG